MRYRELGSTGKTVSEIGFGAWGIGKSEWVGASDEQSLATLKAARDAGITLFDTALAYGDGHSEQLISQAFGKSHDVVIASKVPPKNYIWPAQKGTPLSEVFPREHVVKSLDRSLKNLGREQIDVYQFHVWSDEWANNDEWLGTVRTMIESGKVEVVGISINDHQPSNSLQALATGLIREVQVIFNIFDQSPEDELLPYCHRHGIGVLARVPFDEGSLTGNVRPDTKFPDGDFRNEYFGGDRKQQVWDRVQGILRDTGTPVEKMPELALQYCLSHPAVSSVIPGMRSPQRVAANVLASDAGRLPQETLDKLRNHRWVRGFYS
jgi:aryl-alcohol dehydrogenase-like predicted oxidoreductase